MGARLSLIVISLAFAIVAHGTSTIYLAPAARASNAPNLSQIIAPSFAGMGIEPSNLYSFTGGPNRNRLTPGLLQNLGDYSGVPPQLRLGGNSQDQMIWDADWDQYYFKKNPNPIASGSTPADMSYFGPTYFECLNRLPLGSPIVIGLNLAYDEDDWASRIVASAQAALTMLENPTIIGFEIGNEPDLYKGNGFRDPSYGGGQFVADWLVRAEIIYTQVLKGMKKPSNFFEPATTASTIGKPTFEIASLVLEGINATVNGTDSSYLSGWNQHDYFYFLNVTNFPLTLEYLMNLDNTEAQFAYWAGQTRIALDTGLPYYLREMASAGPTGLQGISDTFGASLWTLNFFLFAATLNISSVDIHMTDNSYAAPWKPNTIGGVDPHVRPSYYAFAAFAQLVGNCNGTARVAKFLDSSSNIRVYGMYGDDMLKSIVMINSNLVNDTAANQSGVTFGISIPSLKNQLLYLSRLTADGANATSGTTWNGLSYSDSDGSSSGNSVQTAGIARFDHLGRASISVRNTEAIIANIGWVLGSNAVVTPNATDAKLHNSKSDTSRAGTASAGPTVAASSSVAEPSTGTSSRESDASKHSLLEKGAIYAMVAGAASLGAAHVLWRGW